MTLKLKQNHVFVKGMGKLWQVHKNGEGACINESYLSKTRGVRDTGVWTGDESGFFEEFPDASEFPVHEDKQLLAITILNRIDGVGIDMDSLSRTLWNLSEIYKSLSKHNYDPESVTAKRIRRDSHLARHAGQLIRDRQVGSVYGPYTSKEIHGLMAIAKKIGVSITNV